MEYEDMDNEFVCNDCARVFNMSELSEYNLCVSCDKKYVEKCPDYFCNECVALCSESDLDGNGNCESCAYDLDVE